MVVRQEGRRRSMRGHNVPSDDILIDLPPKAWVISWAIFKHPNLGFCRFIATTASIAAVTPMTVYRLHSHAAPRTPLESPNFGGKSLVTT